MQNDHTRLKAVIERTWPDSHLEPVTEEGAAKLLEQYPGLPGHYVDFLRHIGWGSLGMHFALYSGPVDAKEIYGPRATSRLGQLVLIGDNYSEWHLGFDTSASWRLVE